MDRLEIEAPQGDWWKMAYGAGYPDWLITSPLPPAEKGERWVWTGRAVVPLPSALYEFWLEAHRNPVTVQQLRDVFAPYLGKGESLNEMMRLVWSSGLFIGWPWGHLDAADTPEAIALQSNMLTKPDNPLPGIIPDDKWPGLIRLNQMVDYWRDARERTVLPGGLYDVVQDLLHTGVVWLVAQPLLRVEP